MAEAKLSAEGPEGATELELDGDDPSAVLKEWIAKLNGNDRTIVTVHRGRGHLSIGGGGESGLVVYATPDASAFYQVTHPDGPQDPVKIVAGGKPGLFPARHVVDADEALKAAESFAKDGELCEELAWVKA